MSITGPRETLHDYRETLHDYRETHDCRELLPLSPHFFFICRINFQPSTFYTYIDIALIGGNKEDSILSFILCRAAVPPSHALLCPHDA